MPCFRFQNCLLAWLFVAFVSLSPLRAADRLSPGGIAGALVLAGQNAIGETRRPFVDLAGGEKASIVVVAADTKARPLDDKLRGELAAPWLALHVAGCTVVSASGDAKDAERRSETLQKCTGVWLEPDVNATPLLAELVAVRQRRGVVGIVGENAAAVGELRLQDKPGEIAGTRELPGTLLAFSSGGSKRATFAESLAKHPGFMGIELDDAAALIVRGRALSVVGSGKISILLSQGAGRPARIVELTSRQPGDLTEFRRAALERSHAEPYPSPKPGTADVPNGSLVIVGGGGMPAEVTRKFIELAGGPEGLIVVLPTALPDPLPPEPEGAFFRRAGAKHVVSLSARELASVESAENLAVLKQARGIWFGGGRQWRFVDAYENTQALDLMRDVLRRGGVIGGSSAGATIQGEYLCRGSPLGPQIMMCEGYERGFAFLPGVAIDQHFAQRKRFSDMTALIRSYPQFLGLGLDEATAIIVQGHAAEVMGPGSVHVYNPRSEHAADQPDHESLKAGEHYDLHNRARITPPEKKP